MLDVYVDRRYVAMRVNGREPAWGAGVSDLAGAIEALVRRRSGLRRDPARVWLGGSLARPFLAPGAAGLRSAAERERVALACANAQTGLAGPCRLWLESGKGATMGVAIAQAELAAVESGLREAELRPASLTPWWAEALRAAVRTRSGLRALGVFEGDALTVLVGDDAGFSQATTLVPVAPDAARATWRRSLFSAGLAEGEAVYASLCTEGAGAGAPAGLPFGDLVQWDAAA